MTENVDYYKILGVSKNALFDEIKKKYRELAIKFHPDKMSSSLSQEMMKKINEAYEVLSDTQKRKLYDENYSSKTESKTPNQDFDKSKQTKLKRLLAIWKAQAKIMGIELGKSLAAMAQSAAQSQAYSSPNIHDRVRRRRQRREPEYDFDDDYEEYDDYEYCRPKKYRKSKRRRKQKDDEVSSDHREYFGLDDSDFGYNVDEVFSI